MAKGDNNDADDTTLDPVRQSYLYRHQVIGSVRGYITYIGYAKSMLGESVWMTGIGKAIIGQTPANGLYHIVKRMCRPT
jgi:hypothetical protein